MGAPGQDDEALLSQVDSQSESQENQLVKQFSESDTKILAREGFEVEARRVGYTRHVMIGRFLLGILKGGVIGAAIGYGATRAGVASGGIAIGLYGVVGAVVGLVCGRPLWRHETIWTPILKAIFGFGLGIGLGFAARKWLGGVHLPVAFIPGATEHAFPDVPALLGPAVGIVYGILVEVDDAVGADSTKKTGA